MNKKIICYCKNVTLDTINKAIEKGATSIDDIKKMTLAATGNKCKIMHPEGRCCQEEIKGILEMKNNKMKNNKMKKKVLFVCIHNSARSQMAEAFLKEYAGNQFDEVESAGLEPGTLNPLVVEVMQEIGIDISKNKTKSVFDLYKQGKIFHYVIAVCQAEAASQCPVFPSLEKKMHWEFDDPSSFKGTEKEKLEFTRKVREEIKDKIKKAIASNIFFD